MEIEKNHHINGKILGDKILDNFDCPKDIKEKVLGCILNHRSSRNATNNEELCVCDADILAFFDNIPMAFSRAFIKNSSLNDVRKRLLEGFEKEYNDLSDRTKAAFKQKYELIKSVVIYDIKI